MTTQPSQDAMGELRDNVKVLLTSDVTSLIPPEVDEIAWYVDRIAVLAEACAQRRVEEAKIEENRRIISNIDEHRMDIAAEGENKDLLTHFRRGYAFAYKEIKQHANARIGRLNQTTEDKK